MKYMIALTVILVLTACKQDTTKSSSENTVSPYMRVMPVTGRDQSGGMGIGLNLGGGMHLDLGSGQINFGVGF
jgi:hypothetical protein